jgi:hypothetical protein
MKDDVQLKEELASGVTLSNRAKRETLWMLDVLTSIINSLTRHYP